MTTGGQVTASPASGHRWAGPDPGDVNTQVRNIYAKLQACDRFSAVQRARELRLLAPAGGSTFT